MTKGSIQLQIISKKCGPLTGTINVPGDKSISHRSLMFGTLAVGETTIKGLLESEDVLNTANAMRSLGAIVQKNDDDSWRVSGVGIGTLQEPETILDFGNAGTGARLVMGIVGSHPISATFVGDNSLSNRPMARVLDPLRSMGAEVIARNKDRLPLSIRGPQTALTLNYQVPVPSAQVKSAVLFAGLNAPGITSVVESTPTRDHTERMLKQFGGDINVTTNEKGQRLIELRGHCELKPQNLEIPGDPSSAAFPIVAALITPDSDITIENVLINPYRSGLITTLQEMGGSIELLNERDSGGETVADIHVKYSKLKGIDVPAERAPLMIDEYPILAIAASFATGETNMTGLEELRIKESDRLAAVANGLKANGINCVEGESSLKIVGNEQNIGGGLVKTHLDHRIAMSFLILGTAASKPVSIDDGAPILTSFPNFIELINSIGSKFSNLEIQ